MPPAERVRTIVTDASGNIVADSGPVAVPSKERPDTEVDFEELGNGVAEGLEDLAVLARQAAKVGGKAQRIGKMISQVVGPLNRPLPERPPEGPGK